MSLKEQLIGLKEKLSQEIDERISSETISDTWKAVRNISGIAFIVLSITSAAPITIPIAIAAWVDWGILATGLISGRAQLNKGKLLTKK